MADAPLILWFRRDLRLDDNPMLTEAAATGRPLVAVFVLDPQTEGMGAAAKGRLGLAIAAFSERLASAGLPLLLRRGDALACLRALVGETGAAGVWWGRQYDPAARARDGAVKLALKDDGIDARSFAGHTLAEPWEIETGQGTPYRVYTPFWKALRQRGVVAPSRAPSSLRALDAGLPSDPLPDWQMDAAMRRGAAVVWPRQRVGEAAALRQMDEFLASPVQDYAQDRDRLDMPDACSGLSENLAWGEIGPRRIWHAAWRAREQGPAVGERGAERFLMELAWRDFGWHLMYHFPQIATRNWREGWEDFPWRDDGPDAEAWRRAQTGEDIVDAAMRELYVTGRMHNRARMIVASYLTKHLLTHWKVGLDWFADCLTDWDPASNAMGWQWVAGSGPDASPYFRIFNPATQAERFDPDGAYRRRWLDAASSPHARAWFDAVPRHWGQTAADARPPPIISLAEGRALALSAYDVHRSGPIP